MGDSKYNIVNQENVDGLKKLILQFYIAYLKYLSEATNGEKADPQILYALNDAVRCVDRIARFTAPETNII